MTTTIDPADALGVTTRSRWLVWTSLLCIIAAFLLRIPAIVAPFGPDQGLYATIAWAMEHGLRLYTDLFEQKPPGLYLTYRMGFAIFGSKASSVFWLDYVAAALTTLALFDLCRRLVDARFGSLVAAVFALGTLPAARHSWGGLFERSITETFICPLVTAAAWATTIAIVRSGDRFWAFAAGLFAGAAMAFKPMTVVYWPAFVAWTWFMTGFGSARRFAVFSAVGAAVVPTLVIAWMWTTGILTDAWIILAEYNRAYLAVGDKGTFYILDTLAHEVWRRMKTDELWALGSLGAAAAVAAWPWWRRTRIGAPAALGVLWLGAAVVAVALNGPRMFQTYFMPALIPLSLLCAWLIDRTIAPERRRRTVSAILVLVFTGLMLYRSRSIPQAIDVITADTRQLFGRSDRQEYLRRFQSRYTQAFSAADNERLAEYLHAHTNPDERLFIFGMTASAYFLSERLPASRFLFVYPAVSNMIDRPEFRVETLAAELTRTAPRYIVLQRFNRDSFSGWRASDSFAAPPMVELLRSYTHETDIGGFSLYRRN